MILWKTGDFMTYNVVTLSFDGLNFEGRSVAHRFQDQNREQKIDCWKCVLPDVDGSGDSTRQKGEILLFHFPGT